MASDCQNTPLPNLYSAARKQLIDSLKEPNRIPYSPLDAFSLLFAERLDVGIQRRVAVLYATARDELRGNNEKLYENQYEYEKPPLLQNGSIYVFRDARDPEHIIKIGSTRQRVDRRLSQWRAKLGDDSGESVFLLFSYRTCGAALAEAIVHALLSCSWVPNRYNTRTGARLVEYYRVYDLDALNFLCQSVIRHVDYTFEKKKNRRH